VRDTLLCITSPDLAFPLAKRRLLVRHADFMAMSELRAETSAGKRRGPVLLVLPRAFVHNERGAVMKQAFRDVPGQEIPLQASSEWVVWKSGS
jgi:hypothetical protein